MTDLDAACYLKELQAYNKKGVLTTPKNTYTDTFWDCALDHAIRALLEKSGVSEDCVTFSTTPNGSVLAFVDRSAAEAHAKRKTENVYIHVDNHGYEFVFRVQITYGDNIAPDVVHARLQGALAGVRPADVESAVTGVCLSEGWEHRFLPREATGFPHTMYVSVSS